MVKKISIGACLSTYLRPLPARIYRLVELEFAIIQFHGLNMKIKLHSCNVVSLGGQGDYVAIHKKSA